MKWVLSHQLPERHYWVLRDAAGAAAFTYHLHHHSIRIKAQTPRLFFLQTAGFFHKKVLLRSEYGVPVGEAQLAAAGKPVTLTLNGHSYFFSWDEQNLSFFNKNKILVQQVRVECRKDIDLLERFAFVFSSVWIGLQNQDSKVPGTLMVA